MSQEDQLEQGQIMPEKPELASVMEHFDNDNLDEASLMSNVDFNTRLSRDEISLMTAIDTFVRMGIYPEDLGLTRQMKRLNISRDGLGREEKVRIAQGERERVSGGGFMNKLGSVFQRQQ